MRIASSRAWTPRGGPPAPPAPAALGSLDGAALVAGRPRSAPARSLARTAALRLGGAAALIALWALAATQFTAVQLPRPELVLEAAGDNLWSVPALELAGLQGGYVENVLYTLSTALVAAAVGGLLGFVMGIASARSQLVRDAASPLLVLFATVPPLVAAPFVLIWAGPGQLAQSTIVAFLCFVVVALGAQNAALTLHPSYEEWAATLGASPRQRLLRIVVPASLPAVIIAVRLCLVTAWSLQCAGELLGSDRGVGYVVNLSQQLADTAGAIAIIVLLALAGLVVETLVVGLLRRACRWQAVEAR